MTGRLAHPLVLDGQARLRGAWVERPAELAAWIDARRGVVPDPGLRLYRLGWYAGNRDRAAVTKVLEPTAARRCRRVDCTAGRRGKLPETHAPYRFPKPRSGDLDLVIERASGNEARRDEIFKSLGFERTGRHWRHGDQLFVELVSGPVAGPAGEVRVGGAEFRVVKKEVVLRGRLVGFKHWKHTAYGEQAIDMLAAFEGDLDMSWLGPELQREDAFDALEQLRKLASSDEPVNRIPG